MATKALILVDFQQEWTITTSDYYVGELQELRAKTNRLIDQCRKEGYKIIFTKHVEEEGEAFTGERAALLEDMHQEAQDIVITKHRISSFYQTSLTEELEGIAEIVVCGILTNLCVRSLVQDAYDRDFSITVIQDCCIAFDEETHNFTIRDLQATREEIMFLDLDAFSSS